MPFAPQQKGFSYKKHITQNSNTKEDFIYTDEFFNGGSHRNDRVVNLPNWLEAINQVYDNTVNEFRFRLQLKENVVRGMEAKQYTAQVSVAYDFYVAGNWQPYTSAPLYITLEIFDTVKLSIDRNVIPFKYIIGNPIPSNQTVQLQAEGNWNIITADPWVTVSPPNGLDSSPFSVGVNPSGFPVGNYESDIQISAPNFIPILAKVLLEVTGQDTEVDFLYLNPQNLEFITEFEVPYNGTKSISIESSGNWTASESVAWLSLSETSGTAGTTTIDVSLANNDAFDVGTLTTTITFTMGDIIKTVNVKFTVVQYFETGIESEGFYYAKDRNKLSVTSILPNTYLQVGVTAANGQENKQYTQEAPYLNGVSSIIIGEETEVLQPTYAPSNSFTTRILTPVAPVVFTLNATNINKSTNSQTAIKNYTNVRFLKGKTPTVANKLCYIPENISVTKNAVLSLVVKADLAPEAIEITGDVTATLSASALDGKYAYNAIVNLADLALEVGHQITITFGSLEINATIIHTEPEVNTLAFLNEWNFYEFFETTGFLTRTPEADKTTTQLAVEGQKHTKTVSIDVGEDYTLVTGWIYTQQEVDWLAKILNSKRIFVYQNGAFVELQLTTKTLEVYKTREYLKSYALKFKKAVI